MMYLNARDNAALLIGQCKAMSLLNALYCAAHLPKLLDALKLLQAVLLHEEGRCLPTGWLLECCPGCCSLDRESEPSLGDWRRRQAHCQLQVGIMSFSHVYHYWKRQCRHLVQALVFLACLHPTLGFAPDECATDTEVRSLLFGGTCPWEY